MKRERHERVAGRGALELFEEAVHLLRLAPAGVLLSYFAGAVPFVLALLYFIADMSRGSFASDRAPASALWIALWFLWLKTWQAVFAAQVRARLVGRPATPWTVRRVARVFAIQAALQPLGLLVLPLSAPFVVTFVWGYAFLQSATAFAAESPDARSCATRASRQANLWKGQGAQVLLLAAAFGLFVLIDIAAAIASMPALVKMFLGVETMATRGAGAFMNTTFFAAALAIAWLCLDPVLKTIYILRCFYGESLQTGEDLKADLRAIAPGKAALVAALLLLVSPFAGAAENPAPRTAPAAPPAVAPADVERAIEETLSRREYDWRLPREQALPSARPENWLDRQIEALSKTVLGWAKKVREWVSDLFDWVKEKFFSKPRKESASFSFADLASSLQTILFVLLAIVASAAAIIFLRAWRQRGRKAIVAQAVAATPDLTDENVTASQLPEDGWLALARDLMQQGNLRLALRALYLASLAHLAHREFLSIAKFKSNRDYERELRRRARALPELQSAFADNVTSFDRAWYGRYEVTPDGLTHFQSNLERIRTVGAPAPATPSPA